MKRIYLEKRSKRSDIIIEALRYYMESVTRREDLRALVLANMDGLVISEYHSDFSVKPEEIASYCPLIVKVGGVCYDGKLPVECNRDFAMLMFFYHDQPLYLVAVGEKVNISDIMLSMMEGVQRIIGN